MYHHGIETADIPVANVSRFRGTDQNTHRTPPDTIAPAASTFTFATFAADRVTDACVKRTTAPRPKLRVKRYVTSTPALKPTADSFTFETVAEVNVASS